MKKKWVHIVVISLIIIFMSVFIVTKLDIYRIPTVACNTLFGTTPNNFIKTQGAGSLLQNGYTFAWVDKDGNLAIAMTDQQRDQWKQACVWLQVLSLAVDKDLGVEIRPSDDWTYSWALQVAPTCNYEISEDYTQLVANPDSSIFIFPFLMGGCIMMQVLDKKACEDICVEYIELNKNGEIIDRVLYPAQEESGQKILTQ